MHTTVPADVDALLRVHTSSQIEKPSSGSAVLPSRGAAWKLLIAAVFIGVAGDALLRGQMPRLGVTLWIAQLLLFVVTLGGRGTTQRNLLLGGTMLAAAGMAWRDAEVLYAFDLLSVLCMGALTVWYGSIGDVRSLTVFETLRAIPLALINALGGTVGVLERAQATDDGRKSDAGTVRALIIGTILALPPLVVVTSLLASSDKIFDSMLSATMNFLAVDGLQHAIVAFVLAWTAAGWLRAALGDPIRAPITQVRPPALAFTTVSVGLYALIGILALFLATQARVLFGGAAFLMATQGLTVANYAREGFFQLVVASGVVLATLVAADWLLDTQDAVGRRRYRLAGAVLVALVGALLVSAVVRMSLYVTEFGLSIDRAVASAVMVWVVAALVAFTTTIVRDRSQHFAPVTLVATVGWVALLNLVNLEGVVVRVNAARAAQGQPFDAEYHATLSADALPALRAAAVHLNVADCQALEQHMRRTWEERLSRARATTDWRGWDYSRARLGAWWDNGARLCSSGIPVALR